jgi:hypothetical protein
LTIVSASEMYHGQRWDQLGGFAAHRAYDDPNIVYSAHIYEPWGFVTQAYGPYTWPANPADNPNPGDGNYDWYYGGQHTRLALEKHVLAYGTEADAGGFRHWMVGEFGAVERADPASRQAFFERLTLASERAGGGWSLWKGHGDDHEMAIYDDATTPGGERTLVLDDPATPVSLGLAPRPAVPLTVSVSGLAEQDLLHPFGGRSYAPAEGQTLALSGAGMGGAGGSARVVRDGQGAVTVTGTGAPAGVGIPDDAPLRATVTGVQRAQIEGDDEIAVLQKTVPPAGSWLEIASGAGHDRLDLTAFKGGVRVNAGSGDDRIALHGKGGTAAAAARVDGAVGTDTVVLEGLAADWRLLTRSDPEGPAQLAKSTAYGSYLLVNVKHVAFAGAAGQAAQGGGFDLVA